MRSLLAPVLAAVGLMAPVSSQMLYVDSAVSASGNGTSWAQAFKDLAPALAVATSGTEIWVASGFYGGAPYVVPAGVTVKGRFRTGDVTNMQREYNNVTVLYGFDTSRVLALGAGSVVDGFTVQNGKAPAPGGGGALIDGVDATIRNCFFLVNNDTAGAGAALLVRNGANPTIESSVFYLNGDDSSGAAIDVDNASGTYINLTVDTNWFSGMRFKNGATPTIINSIFSNNGTTSGRSARGIEHIDTGSNPSMTHNMFFNNSTSLYLHGATELTSVGQVNGLSFSANNLDADPQYEVPIAVYRVPVSSPCVDAGSNIYPPGLQGVYDNSRVIDGNLDTVSRIDIGAYEFADATLRMPVDNHKHIHINGKSAAGLPIWIWISPGVNPLPQSFWRFEPFGTIYIDLSIHAVFLMPPNQVLNYPSGAVVPGGIPIYAQAFTTNLPVGGLGVNFSNPAVHVTNG